MFLIERQQPQNTMSLSPVFDYDCFMRKVEEAKRETGALESSDGAIENTTRLLVVTIRIFDVFAIIADALRAISKIGESASGILFQAPLVEKDFDLLRPMLLDFGDYSQAGDKMMAIFYHLSRLISCLSEVLVFVKARGSSDAELDETFQCYLGVVDETIVSIHRIDEERAGCCSPVKRTWHGYRHKKELDDTIRGLNEVKHRMIAANVMRTVTFANQLFEKMPGQESSAVDTYEAARHRLRAQYTEDEIAAECKKIEDNSDLHSILQSMLYVNVLVRVFMQLLSYARKHEIQNESLILTDEERVAAQQERDKVFKSKTISKCIEARDFGAFIDANRGELSPFLEEFQGVLDSAVSFVSALEDAFVHSFDGENELLYCIFVNRTAKRVYVIFRSLLRREDYISFFNVNMEQLDTAKMLLDYGFNKDKKILVHTGFKRTLDSKYDAVISDLEKLYGDPLYSSFDLYVTGHSLGGALAPLFAFKLTCEERLQHCFRTGRPVTCVSIGSPCVGGKDWREAFELLEKEERLRHLRVTNEADLVPAIPGDLTYIHTGINLHLKPNGLYEIDNTNVKSPIQWWTVSISTVKRHMLADYWERSNEAKNQLRRKSIAGLYLDAQFYGKLQGALE